MTMVVWAGAEPLRNRPTRQVDLAGYTVISDASDKVIVEWVRNFDRLRRAGQQIIGVTDDELLPLTILLFDRRADFLDVLPPNSRGNAVMAVGLDQQPVIALDAESRGSAQDLNTRFAVLMWLLGSSGLSYDRWVLQGMTDIFGAASLHENDMVVGATVGNMKEHLNSDLKQYRGLPFQLGSAVLPPGVDWLAVHYLVIGEQGWQGLDGIKQYQSRVTLGESRELAFKSVFGLDPAQAAAAMEQYFRKGKLPVAKLPWHRPPKLEAVPLRDAEPGLRELCLARLMLQLGWSDYDRAQRFNEVAIAARPDDVRVQENLALYGVRSRQPELVTTALNRALAMGTRNQVLRLQWCVNTINEGFQRSGGFVIDPNQATAVADELHRLLGGNANRVTVFELLAQVVPSIEPARAQDREMLEAGLQRTGGQGALLKIGLAAWTWRHGQRNEARQQLQALLEKGGMIKPSEYYAQWLTAQLAAEDLVDRVDASMAANDFAQTRALLNGFAPELKPYPALQQRIDAQSVAAGNEELLSKAEGAYREGDRQQAGLLLGTLPVARLPASLQARAKALAEHLKASTPDPT